MKKRVIKIMMLCTLIFAVASVIFFACNDKEEVEKNNKSIVAGLEVPENGFMFI